MISIDPPMVSGNVVTPPFKKNFTSDITSFNVVSISITTLNKHKWSHPLYF